MGQIKFMTSIVLIALFSIAIITFAINFAVDNDSRINIQNDSNFVGIRTQVSSNATQFYTDVKTSSDALQNSTVSSQIEATEGGTSFKVGPGTALAMAFSVLTGGFTEIFGAGNEFEVFLTALISVLGLISFMYIYKTWAGRNPD